MNSPRVLGELFFIFRSIAMLFPFSFSVSDWIGFQFDDYSFLSAAGPIFSMEK